MNHPAIDIDSTQYAHLLEEKCSEIAAQFSMLGAPEPEIFQSPPVHFRMRAEFRIWHEKTNSASKSVSRCYYAMFNPDNPRDPVEVDTFPVASTAIYKLMQPLLQAINNDSTLNKKLFQIEFLSSTLDDVVVTLIYHRQLDEQWEVSARQLESRFDISVIGRARKQKIVLSKDYVIEKLRVQDRNLSYEQKENSFTQPNAAINAAMIDWCCNYLESNLPKTGIDKRPALLEMYCGNGNFTIPLAQYFDKVLATEISKVGIASAQNNAEFNQVDNIEFVRLSGEETASALNKDREFRRLKHIDLDSYTFSTVFVDPPRAGLDEQTLDFVQRFDEILYISCNPVTLANNLEKLTDSYTIKKFALFDQFPYTPHCECGVILSKRS